MLSCRTTSAVTIVALLVCRPLSAGESDRTMNQREAESTATQPAQRASQEVLHAATRYLEACVTRDADYIAANSVDDGSFWGIGSAPGPGWNLQETVEHLRGLKKAGWSGLKPQGFVAGDFAWFTDYAKGVLPDGEQLDIRVTLVMRHLGERWKVVHFHVSEGVQREGIKLGS
jgi:SnoaL-like domain